MENEIKKAVEVFKAYEKTGSKKPTRNDRVYFQILFDETRKLSNKKGKAVNWTCSGCVTSMFLVVSNYVNYHYEDNPEFTTSNETNYSEMKLKELRELFPEIKANSVKKFVELIPK